MTQDMTDLGTGIHVKKLVHNKKLHILLSTLKYFDIEWHADF